MKTVNGKTYSGRLKKDLRVKKTINAIYQVFEEMINEMEYERMTVKKLSEHARISKKTFYNYYSSWMIYLWKFRKIYLIDI